MLEGKNVNLRILEKEDLPFYVKWVNDPSFFGEYNPLEQTTKTEMEKNYDNAPPEKIVLHREEGWHENWCCKHIFSGRASGDRLHFDSQ